MVKYNTFKELLLKNISLNDFKEKTRGDYNIQTNKGTMSFGWKNFSEQELSYIDSENNTMNKTIYCIEAFISSVSGENIDTKKVNVLIIEKGEDLLLVIKGNSEIQTKIKSKLLGKYTSLNHIKELWNNTEVKLPESFLDVNFLLWLIDLYQKKETIVLKKIPCKIIDISYLSDNGVYLSGIKKKGMGNNLTNDPIIKATIASVDTIDALGLKIRFNHGILCFILHSNGEIDLNYESYINLPTFLNCDVLYGIERIIYFIKEILVKELILKYKREFSGNDDYFKNIKYQFLLNTIEEISQILNINVTKELDENANVQEIILK